MFITKKKHAAVVAGLNAEIVRLGTLLTDQREVKDLMHSSTARTDRLLERLVDKAASFSTLLNISGELVMPDNIPVYVDDHFGGRVIRQEGTLVIEIERDGTLKTGLTKRPADPGFTYILNRKTN